MSIWENRSASSRRRRQPPKNKAREGSFLVCFKSGACDLDAAVRSLTDYGLSVSRHDGYVTASRPGSPKFDIGISAEPWVAEEAAEIGKGRPEEDAMRGCDARFEVSFDSFDAALDEINTMMEVQGALQDASNGYVFLPWNGSLIGPEG